jgi:hypothetical protein
VAQLAYYIYYRVAPGADANDLDRVRAAQADVSRATGCSARLLAKRDEPELWMEVYESITDPERFEAALAAAVDRHQLSLLVRAGTERKTECFGAPACA